MCQPLGSALTWPNLVTRRTKRNEPRVVVSSQRNYMYQVFHQGLQLKVCGDNVDDVCYVDATNVCDGSGGQPQTASLIFISCNFTGTKNGGCICGPQTSCVFEKLPKSPADGAYRNAFKPMVVCCKIETTDPQVEHITSWQGKGLGLGRGSQRLATCGDVYVATSG